MAKKNISQRAKRALRLQGELRLGALVAELLGAVILTLAALNVANNPFIVSITLLILVLMLGKLSGGHFNPAVTVSLFAARQITLVRTIAYVFVQLLGAMLAVVIATKFLKGGDGTALFNLFGDSRDPQMFRAPGTWRPFWGELAGATVFGFGVASALIGKKEGFEKAFTIGGALIVGLIVALSGSYGVLNPAIALGVGAYTQGGWWSLMAYGIAPLIGAAAGAWLYKLLQMDVENAIGKS